MVYLGESDRLLYFDLRADPEENLPLELTEELRELLPGLRETVESHRHATGDPPLAEVKIGAWVCPAGKHCRRPRK